MTMEKVQFQFTKNQFTQPNRNGVCMSEDCWNEFVRYLKENAETEHITSISTDSNCDSVECCFYIDGVKYERIISGVQSIEFL